MGYALEQKGRLIQAGSCSLLNAETRYAVVELEATAVAWAIKACCHYLLGCPSFIVKTDHQPLVGLFSKDMVAIDNPHLVQDTGICAQLCVYRLSMSLARTTPLLML
jgi:hypothetical protein